MSALKMAPGRPPLPQDGAGRAIEIVSICKGEVAQCNAVMGVYAAASRSPPAPVAVESA